MPLPAQVQKKSDEADALVESVKKAQDEADKKKPAKQTEGKIEVEPAAIEPEDRKNKEEKPTPIVEGDWEGKFKAEEQKYKVLQGKYNSEIKPIQDDVNTVASLKSHVKHLTQRIHEGENTVRELQAKLEEEGKLGKKIADSLPKLEMPESAMSLLSADDRSYLEEEGIDGKSMEIIGKMVNALTAKVGQNNPQPNQFDLNEIKNEAETIRVNKKTSFWEDLTKGVSDFEAINESVDFNIWLDDYIPYTNISRRDALKTAQDHLNSSKAIEIFKGYKAQQTPKKEVENHQINPEEHIEPSSTVGVPEIKTETKGRKYTRQEIKEFYNDAKLVLIGTSSKYTKEEVDRIDADIVKAQTEGRITN